MKPTDVIARIREQVDIPADEISRTLAKGEPLFRNDIRWARQNLAAAGLIDRSARGWWRLTEAGRTAVIDPEAASRIYSMDGRGRTRVVDDDAPLPPLGRDGGTEGRALDEESEAAPLLEPYTIDDVIAEGCFVEREALEVILDRWRRKKNIIVQGPPGTGKTWLARRLAYALIGSSDRRVTGQRIRVVQFHPGMTYEDFVRGWRPTADGRLALVDGILMQAVTAATNESAMPFVLVIEEINRGNPAHIFGEMLTLMEDAKRTTSEAIELVYRRADDERVSMPPNLYIVGTMNVADRSLAMVDLALRRRFAFFGLEPALGARWRDWCMERGLSRQMCDSIAARMDALNGEISSDVSLGEHFRIGHSYVTPAAGERIEDGWMWFRGQVETEIAPLLEEYWDDARETADAAHYRLLDGLPSL
jgi:5-methylcytosine-specific restriction protein B